MNQHLLILLFFTGAVPFISSAPRKYYLIKQPKTWNDALAFCQTKHIDLVSIETTENMIQIQRVAQKASFTSSAWIGLYNDVTSWRWSMGNEPLGTVQLWYGSNPDNWMSSEYCGATDNVGWVDVTCSDPYPFICFDDTYSGTDKYIYFSTAMSWAGAQSYCRMYHTDLASARNQTEASILCGKVPSTTWFGLYRDSWKWSDQTNFNTITWASGQPDNFVVNENCVFLTNGQAHDDLCTSINPFFCYSFITGQKQIIKVKVQSTEDVNDPVVRMVILDKIKEKLSDYVNITVRWREQPNGLVFNKV